MDWKAARRRVKKRTMATKKTKKPKKYTVDISITTYVVVFATSKSEARKMAWEKFTKRPGKLEKIIDPHFFHYDE